MDSEFQGFQLPTTMGEQPEVEEEEDTEQEQTYIAPQATAKPMTHGERLYRAAESNPGSHASDLFREVGIVGSQGYGILRNLVDKGLLRIEADNEGNNIYFVDAAWESVNHKRGRRPGSKNTTSGTTAKAVPTAKRSTVGRPVLDVVSILTIENSDGKETFLTTGDGRTFRVEELVTDKS